MEKEDIKAEDKNNYRHGNKLSLTGRNENEFISIVVNEGKKRLTIVKQTASQISRGIYHLENIKAD